MTTKAELEKEIAVLKELVQPSIEINDNIFNAAPSREVCRAVSDIASALEIAATALVYKDTPMIIIKQGDKDEG